MATITSVVQDDHVEEDVEKRCLAMDLGHFEVSFEGRNHHIYASNWLKENLKF